MGNALAVSRERERWMHLQGFNVKWWKLLALLRSSAHTSHWGPPKVKKRRSGERVMRSMREKRVHKKWDKRRVWKLGQTNAKVWSAAREGFGSSFPGKCVTAKVITEGTYWIFCLKSRLSEERGRRDFSHRVRKCMIDWIWGKCCLHIDVGTFKLSKM